MKNLTTYLVMALALHLGVGEAVLADEADAAQKKYEETMAGIGSKYDKQLEALPVDYIKALASYENSQKKKGNLEGVLAFRTEATRFKEDGTVSTDVLVETPSTLRSMQIEYTRKYVGLKIEKRKRLLSCAEEYSGKLTNLEKTLTKKGDIDGALKVRERREESGLDDAVGSLEFELAEIQAEADMIGVTWDEPEPKKATSARRRSAVQPETVAEWEETGGSDATVHPKGTKMRDLEGKGLKDITQKLESTDSRRRMKYPVKVLALHDIEKVGALSVSTLFRFQFSSRTSKPVSKPMLIVDHYMKKLSRTGDVVLQRTDKVKLRNFSAKDKAIVDTEGMILTTSRPAFGRTAAGRRASRRWRPPHPLGRYFGAIISVFDGTDQLIYQTVTKKELLSGARQETSE